MPRTKEQEKEAMKRALILGLAVLAVGCTPKAETYVAGCDGKRYTVLANEGYLHGAAGCVTFYDRKAFPNMSLRAITTLCGCNVVARVEPEQTKN